MNIWTDLFKILLAIGAFQGFFLTVLLLLTKRGYQNRFLAIILFVLSFSSTVTLLWETDYIIHTPHLLGISTPMLFLLGPAFWLYVMSIFKGPMTWDVVMKHAIPFLICVLLISPFYFETADSKLVYIQSHLHDNVLSVSKTRGFYFGALLIQLSIYLIATHRYLNRTSITSSRLKSWKKWVDLLRYGLSAITICYCVIALIYTVTDVDTVLLRDGLFVLVTVFIHYVAYLNILKSRSLDQPRVKSYMQSTQVSQVKSQLETLILDNRLFLNPSIKMSELAGMLDITPQKLSEIVNTEIGMNFSDYMNQFRVAKAKELLTNGSLDTYDLDGIAQQSGFSGRVNLSRVFKKLTGQSPTSFKQSIE